MKRLSTKIFGSRQGSLKKQKSLETKQETDVEPGIPNVQIDEENRFDFGQDP